LRFNYECLTHLDTSPVSNSIIMIEPIKVGDFVVRIVNQHECLCGDEASNILQNPSFVTAFVSV
jgi:hypothetical protein